MVVLRTQIHIIIFYKPARVCLPLSHPKAHDLERTLLDNINAMHCSNVDCRLLQTAHVPAHLTVSSVIRRQNLHMPRPGTAHRENCFKQPHPSPGLTTPNYYLESAEKS